MNLAKHFPDDFGGQYLLTTGLLAGAYALLLALSGWLDKPVAAAYLLLPLARAVALLAGLSLVRRVVDAQLERAVSFIAAGFSLWLAADAARSLFWVLGTARPLSASLEDLLYLAGGLAVAGGLALFPSAQPQRLGRIRSFLDVIISSLTVLAISWLALVRPVLSLGLAEPALVGWMASRQIIDLILLALAVRLTLFRYPRAGWRLGLHLTGAFALISIADGAYHLSLVMGDWLAGGGLELAWLAAIVLMVRGVERRDVEVYTNRKARGKASRSQLLASKVEQLLPVAYTYLAVGFTVGEWWLQGEPDLVGLFASVAIVFLLVARQGVIAGQAEMRQYTTLVEAAADLAFVCDAHGELLLSNPALEQAIGSDREQSPMNLGEILQGGRDSDELLQDALQQGWSGEVYFRSTQGDRIPVALSLRPVYDERRSEPVLAGTAHDLTALKQRERDLRRALEDVAQAREDLERLNESLEAKVEDRTKELEATVARLEQLNEELKQLDQLKSEFVTLVSHELRAPLTNIRSGVELLLNGPKKVRSSVEETLRLVDSETERLVEFVEMILDLSALEAGRFPMSPEPLNVAALANEVVSRFQADGAAQRIEVDIEEDLPWVAADEKSTMSVLFHLLDNALKYAPEGPVIVRASVHGEAIRIAVSDQGPGIPKDARDVVFDRFHRLDTSDAREVYGRGLGLHLSRRLVEAMGGDIKVTESDSGGAEFEFWLSRVDR